MFPELLLHFRWDSEAFDCFLDGLIVGPDIQAALCEPGQGGIRLFGESCCKIPCPHHIQIVFFGMYFGCPHKIFRTEVTRVSRELSGRNKD